MLVLDGSTFYGPPAAISPEQRVDTLVNIEAQLSHLYAWQLETLAAMAAAPVEHELDREWVKEDVRAALGVSAVAAEGLLELARALTTRLTATLAALKSGRLTFALARLLAEETLALDDEAARAVEAAALAGDCFNSTSFRRRVRRLVLKADTRRMEERRQAALAERRVVFTPQEDGTTELWALLSAEGAARLKNRLDAAAAAVNDERTADQRRADALCEVPGAPGPAVQVVVPISTLLGDSESPGELDGTSIPASLARELANDPTGTWRRLVTDPLGRLLDCGRTRDRPTAALAEHVQARDRTCRFPGCHRRATRCEIDHVIPWGMGGCTDADNLIPLCSRHHHLKHDAGWRIKRLPDGTVEWTSPTGHTYRRRPDEYPD